MRLNRNTLIFIALLAIVSVVAGIFLQDDEDSDTPTVEVTAETIQIFPSVAEAGIISLTISEIREAGDTRPTPIPGNATLEAPTPLPDDVEPEMTSEIVALSKDAETSIWTSGDATTQSLDGTIDGTQLTGAISNLVNLQSNRQFTPSDGNYAQYGLDEPAFDIHFVEGVIAETGVVAEGDEPTSQEAISYRLRIGNRTVGENSYYAFLNEDSETVYIINGASILQNSILNLTTSIPLELVPTPTAAPVLNAQVPFAGFVLTNAAGFTFSNNETEDVIEISRNENNTAWLYLQNGEELDVQQETLQVILNSFSTISGVDQTNASDLTALGLDEPSYRFEARMVDAKLYTLQIGDADPAGTIFYSLVDDFDSVVLIDSDSPVLLLSLFENPPVIVPEITPEATEDSIEVTPEATEDSVEVTPEATEESD